MTILQLGGQTLEAAFMMAGGATDSRLPVPENRVFSPGGAPREQNLLSVFALQGFKAHNHYWGPGVAGESTCFDQVVDFLYRDDPILQS